MIKGGGGTEAVEYLELGRQRRKKIITISSQLSKNNVVFLHIS